MNLERLHAWMDENLAPDRFFPPLTQEEINSFKAIVSNPGLAYAGGLNFCESHHLGVRENTAKAMARGDAYAQIVPRMQKPRRGWETGRRFTSQEGANEVPRHVLGKSSKGQAVARLNPSWQHAEFAEVILPTEKLRRRDRSAFLRLAGCSELDVKWTELQPVDA